MNLIQQYLLNAEKERKGKNVRIRVIGDRKRLPEEMQKEIERVENNTKHIEGLDFVIALNYGGRQEILDAVSSLAEELKAGIELEINDKTISQRLYTKDIPDPDLVIRTSGEMRISNFLIWQSCYSEFYFSDELWPDFSEKHLRTAILSYQGRQRRFGGVKC